MLVEYDYNDLIDRLAKQRIRLMGSKEDLRHYILVRFGTSFKQLSVEQILELGFDMKNAIDIGDLFLKLHGRVQLPKPKNVTHTPVEN
jgi:hypothetical protein